MPKCDGTCKKNYHLYQLHAIFIQGVSYRFCDSCFKNRTNPMVH